MIDRLFVILGAGASHDCAPRSIVSRGQAYWPPLTPDLFDPRQPGYADVLAKYPLAKAAAAEVGSTRSAVSIETQLRERYRDSEHEHDRRIFLGVLPYLQELLYMVSYEFTQFPQNYEVLVTKLLRLKEVVFVSLNYDLLLDNALRAADRRKNDMGWYLATGSRNWSLLKLHGSVDWGRALTTRRGDTVFKAPELDALPANEIELRSGNLVRIRGLQAHVAGLPQQSRTLYFPALAAPVGVSDELVCPPEHTAFLKDRLQKTQPMHLLVIGYSGIDREVVSLIRESERGVKTLTIVDKDAESARGVAERLAEQGISAIDVKTADRGFNDWVHDGQLEAFLAQMTAEPA